MRLKRRDLRRDGGIKELREPSTPSHSADDVAAEGVGFLLIMADVRVAYPPLSLCVGAEMLTTVEVYSEIRMKKLLGANKLWKRAALFY
jgi:hypothetical protein